MGLTAHLPSYSQRDSICFHYEDARHILKLANKGQQLDSVIYKYEQVVDYMDEQLEVREEELQLSGELVTEQLSQINRLQNDLDKSESRRILFKRIAIGLGLVVVGETFILVLV